MSQFKLVFNDGREEFRDVSIIDGVARVSAASIPEGVSRVDFMPEHFASEVGTPGFFLIPSVDVGSHHAAVTRFTPRDDAETVFAYNSMPVYGASRGDTATFAVVEGMTFEYELIVQLSQGVYRLFPRFQLNGARPYEDIVIRFFELSGDDATFAGMARRYRRYQLERGACKTLRERAATNPVLEEMTQGIEVRLRLAWKPVPSSIDDQTEENEPPVTIALTFKKVGEIIREFHRQGIKHAQFCLVGWNRGGHDGRFPDLFPVEPGCGTEEELKELIKEAKELGYLIVCHTNVIEGYSIAKRFSKDNILIDINGSPVRGGNWGGGKSYYFCPKRAHEEYFTQDVKDLEKFGFRGAHYLDVMSIRTPEACYHPDHPLNKREAAEWRSKTLELARETFGASGSEGAWDFCVDSLDYVLYGAFFADEPLPPLCDAFVPFWFIAYHGIQLYNCFAAGVNACSKSDKTLSPRCYSWGGRPVAYFYSKFINGVNHWGDEDIRYHSPEQLRETVAILKADYDRYRSLYDLQYEFIEDITESPDGAVRETRFSDGTVLTCNIQTGEITRK